MDRNDDKFPPVNGSVLDLPDDVLLELAPAARLAALGAVAGGGAILSQYLSQIAQRIFLDGLAGYRPEGPAGLHTCLLHAPPGAGLSPEAHQEPLRRLIVNILACRSENDPLNALLLAALCGQTVVLPEDLHHAARCT